MEDQCALTSTLSLRPSTTLTIYHIYHTGTDKKHPPSYSIHTTPDSLTTILSKKKFEPVTIEPSSAPDSTTTDEQPLKPKVLKGIHKLHFVDNPAYDPRTETAPYFVHLPKLHFAGPAYTLRNGGHKRSPVTALLHPSWAWAGWKLEFGDALAETGVVDGRGVVNARYATKKGEDGTFKGHMVRKRRWWLESGKAWWLEQKAQGFPDREYGFAAIKGDQEEKGELVEQHEEGRVKKEVARRPDEVVKLKWVSPFSINTRKHAFLWRGYQFAWKGTTIPGEEEKRRFRRHFVWCSHLKLVVLVPEDNTASLALSAPSTIDENDEKVLQKQKTKTKTKKAKPKMKEICLARYACVIGQRKAGRLEMSQEAIDAFLADYILVSNESNAAKTPEELGTATVPEQSADTQLVQAEDGSKSNALTTDQHRNDNTERTEENPNQLTQAEELSYSANAKTQKRIRDIIVGTCICMVQSEREKRRFIWDIIKEIAENAGG